MKHKGLRARQRLGKYRILSKLGEGSFAIVYKAMDTMEGMPVALKIPHDHLVTDEVIADFRSEVRLVARLKHPNILPLKNADFVDGRFVIVHPLGDRTLADRLRSRISLTMAIHYAEQMLAAVAFAHEHRVIHCDIKPDNMILFSGGELMLTDFGIAKVALRTVRASGSGTIGYCAPEQAMGQPSFRSDVFALGLILYRMVSGYLPEWPFQWPPHRYDRVRKRIHPDLLQLIRRAIENEPRKRFSDAGAMLAALQRIKRRALQYRDQERSVKSSNQAMRDWRTVRRKQFRRQYGKILDTHLTCPRCDSPVAESMTTCPWCGDDRLVHRDSTRFPIQCPRCRRGLKLDWIYCPWCYGEGFEVPNTRHYSDTRYTGRCSNPACSRKQLMPFMRYCPWCHRKVKRKWLIEGSSDICSSCGWGVVREFWSYCPWCGKALGEI
ncbi:MAG: protein kinase [Pirellulales bacterium]|nr:protein kinase [Pirellulales bacterium]